MVGVIAAFVLMPYGIYTNVTPYALLFVAYTFLMTILGKPGAPFIVMAMAICMPLYVGLAETEWGDIVGMKTRWVYAAVRLAVIINVGYNYLFLKRRFPFWGIGIISLLCVLIFLLYGSVANSLLKIINLCIYYHLFFMWCYYDRLSFDSVFKMATVIFLCVAIYAIVQFHFDIVPYSNWYASAYKEDGINHAAGICGNALVFSAIVLAYHALLIIKLLKDNNMNIALLLLVFYMAIIALERTTIIVLIIEWLVFFAFGFKKIKKNLFPFILLFVLVIILLSTQWLDPVLKAFGERFEGGSGHRFAAYPTVMAALVDNPYGYGDYNYYHIAQLFGTFDFLRNFNTLDNFYLTMLLKYGVFAAIPICFYLFYIIKAFLIRKEYRDLFRSVVLIFLPWLLIGFSFDIENFAQLSFLYYGLLGYVYSFFYKEEIMVIQNSAEWAHL